MHRSLPGLGLARVQFLATRNAAPVKYHDSIRVWGIRITEVSLVTLLSSFMMIRKDSNNKDVGS